MGISPKPLRPHQVKALRMVAASLKDGKRRPILQLSTGAGKTLIAANLIRVALSKGNRVTFTVPAIGLIDQTVEAFYGEGIRDIGVIQADHPMQDWSKPVQVASVQTLARRTFPHTDMVIVDEAHLRFKVIRRWMDEEPDIPFIGLTATPWTTGLGRDWDDLLIAATTAELIEAGFLSPYTIYAPTSPDLSNVKIVAGDYHEEQLSAVMRDYKLIGDVVASWVELGNDDPTLVFAVDRAHARELQHAFEREGLAFGYCDAHTKRDERRELFRDMAARRIKGIVNVGTLTTGVDADVRTLVLARPTKSASLFVQIVGRALRTAPGKQQAVIIDHSDTTLRLGLPCSIVRTKLDDGRKPEAGKREAVEAAPKLPKACPKCKAVKPPGVHQCPACGFAPVYREDVPTGDGKLAPIKGGQRALTWGERQKFYSGLLTIAEHRQRKHGWAAHAYREKFGEWPNDLAKTLGPISEEVARFVKAKDIRYAKALAKGRAA